MANSFGRRVSPGIPISPPSRDNAENGRRGRNVAFPKKLLYLLAGILVLWVISNALTYGDVKAQRLITEQLSKMPLPAGPMHDPVFNYSSDAGGWCGTALTFDQRPIGYFATTSGDTANVTVFPNSIQDPKSDTERLINALYVVCQRTGHFSRLNGTRLYIREKEANQKLKKEGAAPFKAISLHGQHYRIPGDYVWGRMPALTDPETTESSISLRGRMPNFTPGLPHDRIGRDLDRRMDGHGFHDVALEVTTIVLTDTATLGERIRETQFGKDEVVSRQADADGTHTVYRRPHVKDDRWAVTDVYERDGPSDWVTCPRQPVPSPSCQLNVAEDGLLHQVTFGIPWLGAKWQAADGIRARWKSWRVQ